MSAYENIRRNLERTDDLGRVTILGLARGGSGLRALALFCATQNTSREAAAAAIGCEPADLDAEIEAFGTAVTAERQRRGRGRAA